MSLCRPWVCQDNLILCEVYFKDIHTFNLHFIYFKDILYHILLVTIPDISICLGVICFVVSTHLVCGCIFVILCVSVLLLMLCDYVLL